MQKLADIPKTTKTFWYVLGETLCNMIRKRVQKEHKNVDNETFKNYSKNYANLKAAGKAVYKGGSQASRSNNPDMTLTGKTMANLKSGNVTNKNVTIGWLGLHAGIINGLYNRKNYKIVNLDTGDPFEKKEMDFMYQHITKDINKKRNNCKTTRIRIKIGE